ncbi:MAG: glyoxalase [Enterovirga sp.]|nr:glyoxalase [Enterovirga sp.]
MEQRISLVTLGVADVARARAFYDALGWRAAKEGDADVVFYQAGGMVLSLYRRANLARDTHLPDAPTGFAAVSLAYNARTRAEVDAVHAEALAAGARELAPPCDAEWGGYHGHFADPDGHAWEIAWNPFFSLAEDGRISLPG